MGFVALKRRFSAASEKPGEAAKGRWGQGPHSGTAALKRGAQDWILFETIVVKKRQLEHFWGLIGL